TAEPLAAVERVVDEMSLIAAELATHGRERTLAALDQLVDLGKRLDAADPSLVAVSRPIREIVRNIATEWHDLFKAELFPELPAVIKGHTLGDRIVEGKNSDLFELGDERVIKVLRKPDDPEIVRHFIESAEFGEELYNASDGHHY